MGDDQLIDIIRQYDVVYNTNNLDYRDVNLRNIAWEEIAKKHGMSAQECKGRWHKLRNCFNNAMKRRQSKTGRKFAPWRFEKQMSFIKPYWGRSTATLDSPAEEDPLSTSEANMYDETDDASSDTPSNRPGSPASSTSYKIKGRTVLSDVFDMMDTPEARQDNQDLDELDCFFLSISKQVKKLPKTDQIKIKMDLHKAVCEAELKNLETQQHVHTKSEYITI